MLRVRHLFKCNAESVQTLASKQGSLRGGEGDPLLDEQGVSANLGVNEFVWLFVFFVLFQVI